jgi:hypothetical protein
MLLTPTAALSQEDITALATQGINTVDVVGGLQSVSQNVLNQLAALPVYTAGATAPTAGDKMTVIQIAGATAYDTAEDIATKFPTHVGVGTFQGAYGGKYDDVTGDVSPAAYSATGPVSGKTAILATGAGFEDATAASVVGYDELFPVLLTTPTALSPQALAAIQNLGITQVIVVGGSQSVSDAVVSTLATNGVSVLRVAGNDYTDTAQELAQFELNNLTSATSQPEGLGWDAASGGQVTLALGDVYQDALAGAAFAAKGGPGHSGSPQPILLTFDPNTLGTYLTGFLAKAGSSAGLFGTDAHAHVYTVNVVGGTQSVPNATVSAALSALVG